MSGDDVTLVLLWEFGLASFSAAAVISLGLTYCLKPLLAHYALAKPNARSSHTKSTPQGGGIAVILATTIVLGTVTVIFPGQLSEPPRIAVVFSSAILLALVGVTDDIRPLKAVPRLFLQAAAVMVVLATLPVELRILPIAPWWIERALLFVAMVWFVNIVNFMDGIDWMTVAEVVPVTTALTLFGIMGFLPKDATLVSITLCGAMIGFAPLNRPIARLFLGDVGSLPIGLLLGWLLVLLAGRGYFAAAVLLPLYYLADATITLLRRLANGEPVAQAHRSHFYQRALDTGFSVYQIVGWVFTVNIVLAGAASVTLLSTSLILELTMLATGCTLVGVSLWTFNYNHHRRR
jgi:UDP-N-acetylmuramyl pentapeptide phosphotransferase/UDP-N-acetylglucosamine-1-phosphate transferase